MFLDSSQRAVVASECTPGARIVTVSERMVNRVSQQFSHFCDPCDRLQRGDRRSQVVPIRCEDYNFVAATPRSSSSDGHGSGLAPCLTDHPDGHENGVTIGEG